MSEQAINYYIKSQTKLKIWMFFGLGRAELGWVDPVWVALFGSNRADLKIARINPGSIISCVPDGTQYLLQKKSKRPG
jgi:hypothetical protein